MRDDCDELIREACDEGVGLMSLSLSLSPSPITTTSLRGELAPTNSMPSSSLSLSTMRAASRYFLLDDEAMDEGGMLAGSSRRTLVEGVERLEELEEPNGSCSVEEKEAKADGPAWELARVGMVKGPAAMSCGGTPDDRAGRMVPWLSQLWSQYVHLPFSADAGRDT